MKNYKKNLELLTKNFVYSKEMEHDACGVGLIASTEGKKSRAIVDHGIEEAGDGRRACALAAHLAGRGLDDPQAAGAGDRAGQLVASDPAHRGLDDRIFRPGMGKHAVGHGRPQGMSSTRPTAWRLSI